MSCVRSSLLVYTADIELTKAVNASSFRQEGDLTSRDLDDASSALSAHTRSRVAGGGSSSVNLYPYIHHALCDSANVASSNTSTSSSLTSIVLRPHDTRQSTDPYTSLTTVDDSAGLLVTVAFSELVRVKQVLITCATGDERIDRCKIWVNRVDPPNIEEAEEDFVKPDQEFQLLEGERECVEYPVRVARFSSVSNMTIYLVSRITI